MQATQKEPAVGCVILGLKSIGKAAFVPSSRPSRTESSPRKPHHRIGIFSFHMSLSAVCTSSKLIRIILSIPSNQLESDDY